MRIIESVTVAVVQAHEEATKANVRLGGYDMDKCCPVSEFQTFRVRLDGDDINRVFVLRDFARYTAGQTCRLKDVSPEAAEEDKVAPLIRDAVDLRQRSDLAIEIVSAAEADVPLVVIDGNHRAIAQFLMCGTVEDVPAFLCVHPRIAEWGHVPPGARRSVKP